MDADKQAYDCGDLTVYLQHDEWSCDTVWEEVSVEAIESTWSQLDVAYSDKIDNDVMKAAELLLCLQAASVESQEEVETPVSPCFMPDILEYMSLCSTDVCTMHTVYSHCVANSV